MHTRTLIHNNQRALKLAGICRVDAEVGLQWHFNVHALGHVNEGATRPHCRIKRRKLVVRRRNNGAEVFLHQRLMLAQTLIHAQEDNALIFKMLLDVVVNHLRVILRPNASQKLLLRFWNSQALKSILYFRRDVFPVALAFVRRLDVIVNIVKVDLGQIATPLRH